MKILKRGKMREKTSFKKEQECFRKLEYNINKNPLRPSTKLLKIMTIDYEENSLKTRLRKNLSNLPMNLINSNTPESERNCRQRQQGSF